MKTRLLIALTLLMYLPVFGQQIVKDTLCTDFESNPSFINGLYGSWQIGTPTKPFFNTAHSPMKSIVTDSLNPYHISDSSVFYATYARTTILQNIGIYDYGGFEIDFWHKFNTDSLNDFGRVELSKDGGNHWLDAFDSLYTISRVHIFEGTGQIFYGHLRITGNSNGWVHSNVIKDIGWWDEDKLVDSIMVRFTFKSDSIQTGKDGWQIDDLCLRYHVTNLNSVQEGFENNHINVHPNPFSLETVLQTSEPLKDATLNVYNLLGQLQKEVKHISGNQQPINRYGLPSGLYFFEVIQNDKLILKDKLIIIDP